MDHSVVLDDRLLDFSYKLTDLLNVFHTALMTPNQWCFEQLENKSRELLDLTDYVIKLVDLGSLESNSRLSNLPILVPLLELILNIRNKTRDLKVNNYPEEYHEIIHIFDSAVNRFNSFILALKLYFEDEGNQNFAFYLSDS